MPRTRKLVVLSTVCCLLVGLAGPAVAGPQPVESTDVRTASGVQCAETDAEVRCGKPETESFDVTDAFAENTTLDGDTTVTATVTNPNDEAATQSVELRYRGELVERTSVLLAGNSSTTVNFTVDLSPEFLKTEETGVWLVFTVQTRTHGEPAFFYVEDGVARNETATAGVRPPR